MIETYAQWALMALTLAGQSPVGRVPQRPENPVPVGKLPAAGLRVLQGRRAQGSAGRSAGARPAKDQRPPARAAAGLPRSPGPAVPEHGQGRPDGAAIQHREDIVPRVRRRTWTFCLKTPRPETPNDRALIETDGRRCWPWPCSAVASAPKTVDYSAYKQARPKTILVLPPLNNSPDVQGVLQPVVAGHVPAGRSRLLRVADRPGGRDVPPERPDHAGRYPSGTAEQTA